MRSRRVGGVIGAATLIVSCLHEPTAAPLGTASIDAADVAPDSHSVLAAIVSVRTRAADSVAVRFHLDIAPDGSDSLTAPVRSSGDDLTVIPVLGLLPARRYVLRVIAYGAGGPVVGEPLMFVTGQLPSDLPDYTTSGSNPSPGFVVIATGMYGLVIDNTGRIVWYRRFVNSPWLNFTAQPNGRYVARLVTLDPSDIESWIEIDPLGDVTRTFGCKLGLQPRFHDLISEADGGYWILCDETRSMNLSAYGGGVNARVTGTAVQRVDAKGELLFHWSPFDHFLITDVDSSMLTGSVVNWTHGNSLDLDVDGNLVVSFRNLNEITKIDSRTGAVLWRLGGRRNQFLMENGTRPFAGQHSVRLLPSGQLLLLDNIGDSLQSRAERWMVDTQTGTARVLTSFGSLPPVRTLIGGSVQALPGERTLVSFGTEGRVEEYDSEGAVKWRITNSPGYVFRAQRILSLYHPGIEARR